MAARSNRPDGAPDGEQPKAPGADEVQEKVDDETTRGFRGVEVDGTPNENYTVAGVTSGAPTPETDKAQAVKATEHLK